jgi:1-aminocyclopropane-1-carboxylate deaminase
MNSWLNNIIISSVGQAFGPDISLDVLRLDLMHPVVSGNKLFKLSPWLQLARERGKTGILTFGGAWSNHIVAAAFAAREAGLSATGIIRGEPGPAPSPTLEEARSYGMETRFLGRADYRKARDEGFGDFELGFPNLQVVPEGGYGHPGVTGASGILKVLDTSSHTHICCACGTGTMLAGLAMAALPGQQCIGISVVNQGPALDEAVRNLLPGPYRGNWLVLQDHHLGGYARKSPALLEFMNHFHSAYGIPSDFVYTGKLFLALDTLVRHGHFPSGSRILAIHSGGLQGNRSLNPEELAF